MLMPFFIPRERITKANGIQTTIRISRKMANIKGGKPEERDLWNLDKAGIGEQKQAEEPAEAEAEAEAEVDEKAEIDSIDSLICTCDFPMLMRFSQAHDVHTTFTRFFYANTRGLRERTESRRLRTTEKD
jgi:hypothetical protein